MIGGREVTAEEFRVLFNKNRNLPVALFSGPVTFAPGGINYDAIDDNGNSLITLALGLNGEKVVLFKPGGSFELPLAWFEPTSDGGLRQVAEASDITEDQFRALGHSISTNPPK
jgi:hypothetical protein